MDNPDSSELIAVCDEILESGEISSDDAYRLAEWLNAHPEQCDRWPGNLLVSELEAAWADGKVNKGELRKILAAVRRVRRQWSKEMARQERLRGVEALLKIGEMVDQVAATFDLQQPRLPSIPVVVDVPSATDKGVTYQVDLTGPTCNCPDWARRARRPAGHLTRCCKHVREAFRRIEPDNGWPGWFGAFLYSGHTPNPSLDWQVVPAAGSWVLVSTAANGWANVYTMVGGEPRCYGYNVNEKRWSYSERPANCTPIREAVERSVKPWWSW